MTDTTTHDQTAAPADRRLIHWMHAVDQLIHERFADAFAPEEPGGRQAARARAAEVAHELRDRIEGLVSPEDYATTIASLEAIARGLGWDETAAEFGRGFGPHRMRGFGRRPGGRGFGPRGMRGFGPHARHGFAAGFPAASRDGQ